MNRARFALLACIVLGLTPQARADFSLTAPDGRRVLLKDDGTWKYEESTAGKSAGAKDPKTEPALLRLEKKTPFGPNCHFTVRLHNLLPYEIVQLVPYFSAYRASGVMHQSKGVGFQNVRPADTRQRVVEFNGIDCSDIVRIQVVGGDRCEMGELTKFSADKGQCLDLVRVAPSDLLVFEK